jgi:ELWxxDGT repeat protein
MDKTLRLFILLFVFVGTSRCGDGIYLSKPKDIGATSSIFYGYVGHSEKFAFQGRGLKGARFSVQPALPQGLEIDADQAVISGIPTAVSGPTTYTVQVKSDFGEAEFSFSLRVNPSGTTPVLLGDIYTGGGSNAAVLGSTDDIVFFQAGSNAEGVELWKTDGTTSGTSLVKDIESGAGDSTPTKLASLKFASSFSNLFFFSATTTADGTELWKTDGTSAGTAVVTDLEAGAGSSTLNSLAAVSSGYLVAAGNGTTGIEPYFLDATGTSLTNLADISSGIGDSSPTKLIKLGSKTLFFATDSSTYGNELYATDGTVGGTALVKDINSGAGDSPGVAEPILYNGNVYFSADNGAEGFEIWKTDGTQTGTVLVKDIAAGATGSDPDQFTVFNGLLYFVADDGVHGSELWRSDGTSSGTFLVKDINGTASGSTVTLYVGANNGIYLYFTADDGVHGEELWRTDGSVAGTVLVKDIESGATSSTPMQLSMVNGWLFFSASTAAEGRELWKSNGSAAGTTLVQDLNSGANDSIDSNADFYSWQGMLFYPAAASAGDVELYLATP